MGYISRVVGIAAVKSHEAKPSAISPLYRKRKRVEYIPEFHDCPCCYNELGICFTGVLFLKNKKYQCCQKNCNVPVPILLFLLFAMFLKNMLCCT